MWREFLQSPSANLEEIKPDSKIRAQVEKVFDLLEIEPSNRVDTLGLQTIQITLGFLYIFPKVCHSSLFQTGVNKFSKCVRGRLLNI
jgi:hypothetical protein